MRRWLHVALVMMPLLLFLIQAGSHPPFVQAATAPYTEDDIEEQQNVLAPLWGPTIQQWSHHIEALADTYGLDPDFIAAVIKEESDGDAQAISRVGAVGLMGVMPQGPGLEWRPTTNELMVPATNLRWGVAILSEIIRQSGGDFFAALAAYSGGWEQVSSRVPRQYAANVLHSYGQAVAMRSGISPDIAAQWTLAIEVQGGNVPHESLLILGHQPVSGLQTYGRHTVYDNVDESGRAYYIVGYAVPVALVVPISEHTDAFGNADAVEEPLGVRLGEVDGKQPLGNPRVLVACLPSLSRLRGHASTRWFAPSYCPSWHR